MTNVVTDPGAITVMETPTGAVALVRVSGRAAVPADVGGATHVVLDLSEAGPLDPDGLSQLVRARQEVRQLHGGWLCLVAPSRLVLTVLHTMKLERAFPTFLDLPTALAWLGGGEWEELPAPLWIATPVPGEPVPGGLVPGGPVTGGPVTGGPAGAA